MHKLLTITVTGNAHQLLKLMNTQILWWQTTETSILIWAHLIRQCYTERKQSAYGQYVSNVATESVELRVTAHKTIVTIQKWLRTFPPKRNLCPPNPCRPASARIHAVSWFCRWVSEHQTDSNDHTLAHQLQFDSKLRSEPTVEATVWNKKMQKGNMWNHELKWQRLTL